MIYLNKKTCRPKLLEKKVRWYVDSWRPLKLLHKKEKILIPLPRAQKLLKPYSLSSLSAYTELFPFLSPKAFLLSLSLSFRYDHHRHLCA